MLYALVALWSVGIAAALIALWAKVSDAATTAQLSRIRDETSRLAAEVERLRRDLKSVHN